MVDELLSLTVTCEDFGACSRRAATVGSGWFVPEKVLTDNNAF